jgi:hypothetical protein
MGPYIKLVCHMQLTSETSHQPQAFYLHLPFYFILHPHPLSFAFKSHISHQTSSTIIRHSPGANMERKAMPLPRVPGLSLPSFRELEESIFSHRRGEESSSTPQGIDGTDEEPGTSVSPPPGQIDTFQNPYPPLPVRGWNIPPDPSQNVCIHPSLTRDILLISRQAFWQSGFIHRVRAESPYMFEIMRTIADSRTKRTLTFLEGSTLSRIRQ